MGKLMNSVHPQENTYSSGPSSAAAEMVVEIYAGTRTT